MKKIILLSILLIIAYVLVAQTPHAFKYQTVVRDISGDVLPNQFISLQISIHDGTAGGTIVYQETHDATTNQFGLANLKIGLGLPIIGDFISIDWQMGLKFLEIALDPTGGNTYVSMGTSQLLSVPYALYAETSSNDGDWAINGNDLYTTLPGNVGIGTTTPGNGKLEVLGDGSNAIHAESSTGGGFAAGYFNATNPGTYGLWTQSSDYEALFANTLSTTFPAIHASGEIAGVFDGKVGIGTSDPEFKLSLNEDGGILSIGTYGEGDTLQTSGNGARFIWYPRKAALRAGWVFDSNWDNDSIGDFSIALGNDTRASGLLSTALGYSTIASGVESTALGVATEASGFGSTAIGFETKANGYGSIAMGWWTEASGFQSTAMGLSTKASGSSTTALGEETQANSRCVTALGRFNVGGGHEGWWIETDPVFEIGIGNSDSERANALTVLKNGKVGIGTTTPQATLDVNGNINSLGNYLIDGNSIISVEGLRNLLVGVGAGENNTGTWVTCIGDSTGYNNQGESNTFVGSNAGTDNTSGLYNTFVGTNAGNHNIGGNVNTFIGKETGAHNTSGYYNTYLGAFAGHLNETGKWNTCIGIDAGANTQDAIANTFLGSYCGRNINVGDSNVFIGFFAGELETGSNKFIIANGELDKNTLLYGDFVSGNLGVGTKELNHKLNINGNAVLRGEDDWDNPGDQANIFMGDPNHGIKGVYGEGLRFWTFDDPGHDIRFQNQTGVDYMTIKMGNGNVGIGTTDPVARLDVNGDIRTSSVYKINESDVLSITGQQNILVGKGAGINNTGTEVTFVGDSTGINNGGVGNTFIGTKAGLSNLSGGVNTFVGGLAGRENSTGFGNTFIGSGAGNDNTDGINNTFIGLGAGSDHTTGNFNTFIGVAAGTTNSGSNNTFLGWWAGGENHGSNNVFIGSSTGQNEPGSNKLCIDNSSTLTPLIYGEFDNDIININGKLGINNSPPQALLHINQASSLQAIRLDFDGLSFWDTYVDGVQDYNFAYNYTLKSYIDDVDGSYYVFSDMNLKTDITYFSSTLEKVVQLQPCSYRYKDNKSSSKKSVGLIAQDVEDLFPETVHEKEGIKAINYDAFAVIAIQAIKEQQEMIDKQQSQIDELKDMVSKLVK